MSEHKRPQHMLLSGDTRVQHGFHSMFLAVGTARPMVSPRSAHRHTHTSVRVNKQMNRRCTFSPCASQPSRRLWHQPPSAGQVPDEAWLQSPGLGQVGWGLACLLLHTLWHTDILLFLFNLFAQLIKVENEWKVKPTGSQEAGRCMGRACQTAAGKETHVKSRGQKTGREATGDTPSLSFQHPHSTKLESHLATS